MTEQHDPLTEQDPDRRPREELDEPDAGDFSYAGMSDDAAAGVPPDGTATDDGETVGAADADADAKRSGADGRD